MVILKLNCYCLRKGPNLDEKLFKINRRSQYKVFTQQHIEYCQRNKLVVQYVQHLTRQEIKVKL